MSTPGDRVGLGWRWDLAGAIFQQLDHIDIVEIIAEDWLRADAGRQRALRTLGRQVPVSIHGVSLGLASSEPVDEGRLAEVARLLARVEPDRWSEHLAFVRGGGWEIGHLAAPPRCLRTIEGTQRNLERARAVAGLLPVVENVATLLDPPFSTMDEPTWLRETLTATGASFVLDLHNLHANAVNFGFSAAEALDRLPLQRIVQVHLAGGRWISDGTVERLLDDHLHDVPEPVWTLLAQVAERTPGYIDVILERDGRFPPMSGLMAELERARMILRDGRARREGHAA